MQNIDNFWFSDLDCGSGESGLGQCRLFIYPDFAYPLDQFIEKYLSFGSDIFSVLFYLLN